MIRRACGIAVALLFLSLTVPVLGQNYTLHSPKLWTPQEKEQYEKENPPASNDKEQGELQKDRLRKEKEQAEIQKELLKREKERVEKQKSLLKLEKERAEKQKDQVKKEKEQVRKQKEQLKKEMERVKKEKERIRQNQILVKNGVSYREVVVQKGDTLYSISRKYRKEGSSYAETLRFNDIEDSDQIVSGDIIKVPLNRVNKAKQIVQSKQLKVAAPAVQKPQVTAKAAQLPVPAKTITQQAHTFSNNTTAKQKAIQSPEAAVIKPPAEAPSSLAKTSIPPPHAFTNNSTSRQQLFEQAIRSYRNSDCQTAIKLFGRFLAEPTSSVLAADASLFIADCYLKLVGQIVRNSDQNLITRSNIHKIFPLQRRGGWRLAVGCSHNDRIDSFWDRGGPGEYCPCICNSGREACERERNRRYSTVSKESCRVTVSDACFWQLVV